MNKIKYYIYLQLKQRRVQIMDFSTNIFHIVEDMNNYNIKTDNLNKEIGRAHV